MKSIRSGGLCISACEVAVEDCSCVCTWTHVSAVIDKLLQTIKCFWVFFTQVLTTLFVHAEIKVYKKSHSHLKLLHLCLPLGRSVRT